MQVAFACQRCGASSRAEFSVSESELACARCSARLETPPDAVVAGEVRRCLVCPSSDLFVRKDFPQRLGAAIVVAGFAISCVTWYFHQTLWTFGVLFGTALIDVVLYAVMPDTLVCYRCGTEYRRAAGMDKHGTFDLATHERYRQQQARLAELETRSRPDAERPQPVGR